MARIRSPNYPAISLPDAIARIAKIHAAEQHLPAPKEVLAKHIGYNGLNGASLKVISALGKYGLLEEVNGDKMRVSPLAMNILYPPNDAAKAQAISEAAFLPTLFAELRAEWGGTVPSDANMRSYLVRRNFATDAIDRVIGAYRETAEMVAPTTGVFAPAPAPVEAATPEAQPPAARHWAAAAASPQPAPPQAFTENTMRVSMSDIGLEVRAELVDVTGVERLIKILEANKALLPAAKASLPEEM